MMAGEIARGISAALGGGIEMKRAEKLYRELDELSREYTRRLLRECEKDESWESRSRYLDKIRSENDLGRSDHMSGKKGGFEDANDLLSVEKKTVALCEKLGEPLPESLDVVKEYEREYRELHGDKRPWEVNRRALEASEKALRRRTISRLSEIGDE